MQTEHISVSTLPSHCRQVSSFPKWVSHSINLRGSNEKGATMVEAAIIMPLFFSTLLACIYVFISAHRVHSTSFAIQDTLRQISIGPNGIPTSGIHQGKTLEVYLRDRISERLQSLTGKTLAEFNGQAKVFNASGCFNLKDSSHCVPGTFGTFKIVPNDFLIVEIEVPFFEVPYPSFGGSSPPLSIAPPARIRTGTQMANWGDT